MNTYIPTSSSIRLPIGREDFRSLIDKKFLFVDKTLLIKEFLDNDGPQVSLITRPRRFGKTLNLSMLHHFFAEKVNDLPTKDLFNGLKISQAGEQYMAHQGQYPVIFLTFKQLGAETYEEMMGNLQQLMSRTYKRHSELADSPYLMAEQKSDFKKIINGDINETHLKASLFNLTEYLYMHYKKKVMVLIDEYDAPIQTGYLNQYYEKAIGMMRSLLGTCLKTNDYLEAALLTGITRVSKESLFSGLNNLVVYSLLDDEYKNYFGFTEEEVKMLAHQMGYQDKLTEMKAWYNGYEVGTTTLYNPWSITNYLSKKGLASRYWLNTSGNELIKKLLIQSSTNFKQDFEHLLRGEIIHKSIREDMVFGDLATNESLIWSLFFVTGYLKIVEKPSEEIRHAGVYCALAIPNKEIHEYYYLVIQEWLAGTNGADWCIDFINNLLAGRIKEFEEGLKIVLENIVSSHDLAKDPEAFYHGLILGFLATLNNYEIKSNRESGKGRYDIAVIPNNSQALGLLFELKKVGKKATNAALTNKAKQALQQINKKNYVAEFKQRGAQKVLKIALAFRGKDFRLKYEEEQLVLSESST